MSIFVDESGRFLHPDDRSRFYIIGLLFHDQACKIDHLVHQLDEAEAQLGLEGHCFHAGPLLRKEKGYEIMSRQFRTRILSRMLAFAQRVPFRYRCLSVDKRYVDSTDDIVARLRQKLDLFLNEYCAVLPDVRA